MKKISWQTLSLIMSVVMLAMCIYLPFEMNKIVTNERLTTKNSDIGKDLARYANLFSSEEASRLSLEDKTDLIIYFISSYDEEEMTFACLYLKHDDGSLENLSARHPSYEGSPFDPTVDSIFREKVQTQESGMIEIDFTPADSAERVMYTTWQWMTFIFQDQKFVAVVAISEYTIASDATPFFYLSSVILLFCALALIFINVKSREETILTYLNKQIAMWKKRETTQTGGKNV